MPLPCSSFLILPPPNIRTLCYYPGSVSLGQYGTAMRRIILMYRRPLIVVFHIGLIMLSNFLAFLLRFDSTIPTDKIILLYRVLPWLVVIRALMFTLFRLYQGLWRYTGLWDLCNIIAGVLSSTVVFAALIYWGFGVTNYPHSVVIIDAVLLICFMGVLRLGRRLCREIGFPDREKRVLIYGAGDAGEMIVRDMRHNSFYEYEPIGFVDDDPSQGLSADSWGASAGYASRATADHGYSEAT